MRKFKLKLLTVCTFLVLLTWVSICSAGTDVLVDGDPNVQNEISLTLIPGQPNDLVMAYNDNPYTVALGSAWSTDSGASWNKTQLPVPFSPGPAPPPVPMTSEFDPTITADTNGNVFVGFIADGANWQNGLPDSGLYVSKSTDGGQTWGTPVQVSYDPPPTQPSPDPGYRYNDRCQITADTFSASSYLDNIYIAWLKDRGSGAILPYSDIYFSRSTDGGATFSVVPIIINDTVNNDMGNMPVPVVASDGTVYVTWMDYNVWTGGMGTIYIRKSTDGGQTFPAWGAGDHLVRTINLPPLNVFRADGTTDALAKGAPVPAAPNDANTLYIVYAADPDGAGNDDADIFLIKSTDAGQNWSSPLRVNDDNTLHDQILPWIDIKLTIR